MRIWAGKGWVTYTKAQIEQSPHGSRSPQLLGTVSASLPAPLPLRTGSQGTRGTRVRNNDWGKSFPVPAAPAAGRLSSIGVWHGSGAGTGSGGALEARGPYQHAGALQRVAGALEVVPADAVELADVVPGRVVDAVQVGEPAGVEPPACGRRERGGSVLRGWAPGGFLFFFGGRGGVISGPQPQLPAHLPTASGRTCRGSCRCRRRGC